MKVVVVGCGRVGATLARRFVEQGHTVSVVDKSRSAFQRLGEEFPGKTSVGLGFDEDVLRRAGVEGADIFLAITGGDNSNLMAAQIARVKFNVPRVIVKVKDPLRAEVYHDLGMITFCNTTVSAGIIEDAVFQNAFKPVEAYGALHFPASDSGSSLES